MQHFTELRVWQRAHALVLAVYRLTENLPSSERYGLTSQLRRAATSVPTNIAEGSKRRSGQDYARFLNMLGEATELSRMLYALRAKVERDASP